MPDLKSAAVSVMVFLVFLNAASGVLVASGFAEDAGITPSVSDGGAVAEANSAGQTVEVGGGFASTLFQLYASVGGVASDILGIVFAGPIMFVSIGVPGWLVDFMFAPQYLMVAAAIVYTLSGRLL